MFDDPNGPITHFSWAKFIINEVEHSNIDDESIGYGKDIKIINGKVKKWKERSGHKLKPKMMGDIANINIGTLIIGSGVYGALKVPKSTIKYLKQQGIQSILVEKTPLACRIYNDMISQGENIAMFAHGTC